MCKPKSPPKKTELLLSLEIHMGVLIEMLTVIENVLFLLLYPTELSTLIVLEMWEW